MKMWLISCVLLVLLLAACAPPMQAEQSPIPNDELGPVSTPPDSTPAQSGEVAELSETLNQPTDQVTVISIDPVEELVINQLAANLGLNQSEISVVSDSEVEFADSCMGVPMKDVKCAQEAVTGRIIILEAHGVQYEYRVRSHGAVIQPATLALLWTREGGVAGFCDSMTIFLSGEVYGSRCNADLDRTTGTFANLLSKDELEQFNAWIKEFGQVSLDASEAEDVSDRTEITLLFNGIGKVVPGKSDELEILQWIQNLYQKFYP